jgi:hypothetical protein
MEIRKLERLLGMVDKKEAIASKEHSIMELKLREKDHVR